MTSHYAEMKFQNARHLGPTILNLKKKLKDKSEQLQNCFKNSEIEKRKKE